MLSEERNKKQEGRKMKYKARKKNKCIVIKRKIILASKSLQRIKILKQAGLKFKSIKPDIDEAYLIRKFRKYNAKKLVKLLSFSKAVWVCYLGNSRDCSLQGDEIIAGFDTIIECQGKIIGKPKNKKDALDILLFLSNKVHNVHTGIGIIDLKEKITISDSEVTRVYFKKISEQEARDYIKTKEPMDKAGAYAIQGQGKNFIKKISGDYFNVVGLPLKRFLSRIS